jgi:hypothetical protein
LSVSRMLTVVDTVETVLTLRAARVSIGTKSSQRVQLCPCIH